MGYEEDWDLKQDQEQKHWDMEDKRDPIQESLNAEADALIAQFGSEIRNLPELSDSSKEILKSYVAAHSTLSEKRRAYSLAMWVLSKGKL